MKGSWTLQGQSIKNEWMEVEKSVPRVRVHSIIVNKLHKSDTVVVSSIKYSVLVQSPEIVLGTCTDLYPPYWNMLAFYDLEVVIQPTFHSVNVRWVLLFKPIGWTVFHLPDESFLSVVVLATLCFTIGDGGFEISSDIDRSVIRRWVPVPF